jgi:hypothetical protein
MRSRVLTAALVALLAAPALFAAETVLSASGALFSIGKGENENAVYLLRRAGEEKSLILVPATDNDERENLVELEYDRAADKLYVAWVRGGSDVQLASLDAEGKWSEPISVATGDDSRSVGEMRLALTRAKVTETVDEVEQTREATLVHFAWWQKANKYAAKYALVALEKDEHVSTFVGDLEDLAEVRGSVIQSLAPDAPVEGMGAALYPPLAMVAQREGVDIVFGSERNSSLTRVILKPAPQARFWRPGKGGGTSFPPARLVSTNAASIQAFVGPERVILYTREGDFRFVVYANGEWSPVRTIAIDERLTREQVLSGLRRLGGE